MVIDETWNHVSERALVCSHTNSTVSSTMDSHTHSSPGMNQDSRVAVHGAQTVLIGFIVVVHYIAALWPRFHGHTCGVWWLGPWRRQSSWRWWPSQTECQPSEGCSRWSHWWPISDLKHIQIGLLVLWGEAVRSAQWNGSLIDCRSVKRSDILRQ